MSLLVLSIVCANPATAAVLIWLSDLAAEQRKIRRNRAAMAREMAQEFLCSGCQRPRVLFQRSCAGCGARYDPRYD
jgi:hypothetical protein